MAIQSDVLIDTAHRAVIRAHAAASADVGTAVDISALSGYTPNSRISIPNLMWSITSGTMNLQWGIDGGNDTALILSGNGQLLQTQGWPALIQPRIVALDGDDEAKSSSSSSSSESGNSSSSSSVDTVNGNIVVANAGSLTWWTLIIEVKKFEGWINNGIS